jgi:hypothetical protein
VLFLISSSFVKAQVKIDASGKVGLKSTTTNSSFDVLVNGSSFFNGSPTILGGATFNNASGTYLSLTSTVDYPILKPVTTNRGYLGTGDKQFAGVYAYSHYAQAVLLTSDRRLKENFRTIDKPLEKILKIEGLKYDFIGKQTDTIKDAKEKNKQLKLEKNRLGFIAQDLINVVPEAVFYFEDEDRYYIDYNAVIPVLVEAIKELNTEIETLKNTPKQKSATIGGENGEPATLNQNIPNPFSENTTINMYLPNTVSRATLYIYNMQGEQIKYIAVNERGNTSVTIEGHALKAGMYLYTLIADGKEVDTKKMILTK